MKFKVIKCHWSPKWPARFLKTILPESNRTLAAGKSSYGKQILVFVIVKFVKLQDGMFLIFYAVTEALYVLLSSKVIKFKD